MEDRLIFDYDRWLSGHAKQKTMMEKLERSLVPYELFALINKANDKEEVSGEIAFNGNTYQYSIKYDYSCIGHDVYDAVISAKELNNKWFDILLGYNKFKLVMCGDEIKTIYSDKENYFWQVISMFESDDYSALYACRSAYINNVLARYIILRLIDAYRPDLLTLLTIKAQDGRLVSVLAADVNRKECYTYAFSKRDAIELAKQLDGICPDLTVIYFFNQDFNHDGNTSGYDTKCTHVVSARSFALEFDISRSEKYIIEKRMLTLVSLIYNEHIDWSADRVERIIKFPPYIGKKMKEQKKLKKDKKVQKTQKVGLPWYQYITRTLLEDALNVLDDIPTNNDDIFHFLCASNLVNAYLNHSKEKRVVSPLFMKRMYKAKNQMFENIIFLAETKNKNVSISMNSLPSILIKINMNGQTFQFSFRGMHQDVLNKLHKTNVDMNGHFEEHYLQPIATALYMYSYLQRWKKIEK